MRSMLYFMFPLTLVGAAGALAACRDAAATTATAATCGQYPIAVRPSDGAQAAARSDLAAMSPGASMTWNASTGTLSTVVQLATPLPGCSDGHDVHAEVLHALTAHPALFQIDASEWSAPPPYDCRFLGDDELMSVGRARLAARPVARDVLGYTVKRIDGTVHLTAVSGTYLPVVGGAVGDTMAACNTLTASAATATARATALHASVYSQCQRTGTVAYTPRANDGFSFAPAERWSWDDGGNQVLLTGQRTLRVTVNPANYTPELLASAARCPTPDGNAFTVGFDITFDVHSGAILDVKPGLDCNVC